MYSYILTLTFHENSPKSKIVQSLLELFEDQEENVNSFVGWMFNTLKPKYTPKPQGKNIMDEFNINNDFDE